VYTGGGGPSRVIVGAEFAVGYIAAACEKLDTASSLREISLCSWQSVHGWHQKWMQQSEHSEP
jgi:hypothetical protein